MKQAILNLEKKLLLVELPEDYVVVAVFPPKRTLTVWNENAQYLTEDLGFDVDEVGKLSDITEIQCEEWVEWIEEPQYYIDYRKEGWQGDITAKESFFSYLESRGVVFENPLGEKPVLDKGSLWGNPEQDTQVFAALNYQIDKWEEAESKVWNLNNCYLFEIIQ
jgi:hypothetical protein